MTGTDALCAALSELGVGHVFGLPATQNADFFNALPRHGIRPVLATQELSASFMANGYARASGRVAVLATMPGPGFTYALPGLAEARLDSVPIVHLAGTPARDRGGFGHQGIDQAGIAGPLVKAVIEVANAGEVRQRLHEAYRLASEGEPGPVLVHLSRDALGRDALEPDAAPRDASAQSGPASVQSGLAPGDAPASVGAPGWAAELTRLVGASERPVLFLGAGALECPADVARLAERLHAPTFTTLTARGVLPEDHSCSIPFDADRGSLGPLNELLDRSDLVLALGCRFSHNGTAGLGLRLPADRLVHVNTDASALGCRYPARLEMQARTADVIHVLLETGGSAAGSRWTAAELRESKARIGRPGPARNPEPRFHGPPGGTAEAFFALLRRVLPRDAIVLTDSGLHQTMTRRYYEVLGPRGLITPADFQAMGFAIPAAIGAALAATERPVLAVVGDGGFLVSAMELTSAVRERVAVVVLVFNDGFLNLVRLHQLRDDGVSTAVRVATPDLESLAAAMGVRYARLGASAESVLRDALQAGSPTLLEVRLGDSAGIRALRGLGMARRAARRTLGPTLLSRVKRLGSALRRG